MYPPPHMTHVSSSSYDTWQRLIGISDALCELPLPQRLSQAWVCVREKESKSARARVCHTEQSVWGRVTRVTGRMSVCERKRAKARARVLQWLCVHERKQNIKLHESKIKFDKLIFFSKKKVEGWADRAEPQASLLGVRAPVQYSWQSVLRP